MFILESYFVIYLTSLETSPFAFLSSFFWSFNIPNSDFIIAMANYFPCWSPYNLADRSRSSEPISSISTSSRLSVDWRKPNGLNSLLSCRLPSGIVGPNQAIFWFCVDTIGVWKYCFSALPWDECCDGSPWWPHLFWSIKCVCDICGVTITPWCGVTCRGFCKLSWFWLYFCTVWMVSKL